MHPKHRCRERDEVTIKKIISDGNFNLSRLFRGIKGLQEKDPVLKEIKRKALRIEEAGDNKFTITDDTLYKLDGADIIKWKIYVPASIDEDVIMAVHRGMGHLGAERLSLTIRDCMYIKHLAKKARKLISSCE